MSSPYAYLPQRAVLSLDGPDTIALLERLVTHTTTDWTPGEARSGALLTPQGKIIADFLALRTETGALLDVDKDAAGDLEKRLKMFRLRADVEIALRDDLFVLAGVEPADHGARPISGAAYVFIDPRYPGGRLRAFATEGEWAGWHGPSPAEWSKPLPDYHADRITAGVPEQGADFDAADVFPADVNMDHLGGVDFQKGCFVGQEVVSRMKRRGTTRRRTLVVRGAHLVAGAEILADGAPIGHVTSVEGEHGLARVRIDRLAKADTATIGDAPIAFERPDWVVDEMAAMTSDD